RCRITIRSVQFQDWLQRRTMPPAWRFAARTAMRILAPCNADGAATGAPASRAATLALPTWTRSHHDLRPPRPLGRADCIHPALGRAGRARSTEHTGRTDRLPTHRTL